MLLLLLTYNFPWQVPSSSHFAGSQPCHFLWDNPTHNIKSLKSLALPGRKNLRHETLGQLASIGNTCTSLCWHRWACRDPTEATDGSAVTPRKLCLAGWTMQPGEAAGHTHCGRSGGGWRARWPGESLSHTPGRRMACPLCESGRGATAQWTGQTRHRSTGRRTSSLQ